MLIQPIALCILIIPLKSSIPQDTYQLYKVVYTGMYSQVYVAL